MKTKPMTSLPQDEEWRMDFNDGAIATSINGGSGQALLDGEIQNERDDKARALGGT
jgi:hypothetical protein